MSVWQVEVAQEIVQWRNLLLETVILNQIIYFM
jgi:hypothetical protein